MGIEERTEIREIDGVQYEISPVPSGIGNEMILKLLGLGFPMMGAGATVAGALAHLSGSFDEGKAKETLVFFRKHFGMACRFASQEGEDGEVKWTRLTEPVQDQHWRARYIEQVDWLKANLEVNFAPFFKGIKERIPKLKPEPEDGALINLPSQSMNGSLPVS